MLAVMHTLLYVMGITVARGEDMLIWKCYFAKGRRQTRCVQRNRST